MDVQFVLICVVLICNIYHLSGNDAADDEAYNLLIQSIQGVPRVEQNDDSSTNEHTRSKRSFGFTSAMRESCTRRCRGWWWWRGCRTTCNSYYYRVPTLDIGCESVPRKCRVGATESAKFDFGVRAASGSTSLASKIKVAYHSCTSVSKKSMSRTWSLFAVKSDRPRCHVTFRIEDRGCQRRCTSYLYLKTLECRYPPGISYGKMFVQSRRIGDVVNYTCSSGYKLIGPSSAECKRVGHCGSRWEPNRPICKLIRCHAQPPPPTYGWIECASLDDPQATCYRHCNRGFTPKGKHITTCLETDGTRGVWNQPAFECQDTQPPTLTCPDDIEVLSGKVQNGSLATSIVDWDDPEVVDNIHVSHTRQTEGPGKGAELTLGTYIVVFEGNDTNNNVGKCSFRIHVKARRCKPISSKGGFINLGCSSENMYGSECTLGCAEGSELVGGPQTVCEMFEDEEMYWTHAFSHTKCTMCGSIRAPMNGAVSCFDQLQARVCTTMCFDGFDFASAEGSTTYIFTCQELDGKWTPKNTPDNCIKISSGLDITTRPKWRYVSVEDCNNSSFLEQLKENTILALNDEGICNSRCNITRVDVTCTDFQLTRKKRSAVKQDIVVEVTLIINITPENSYDSSANVLYEECSSIDRAVRSKRLEISTPGLDLKVVEDSVSYGRAEVTCPKGTFSLGLSKNCVGCPYGSYYDETNNTCILCPVGWYQDEDSQTSCQQCREPLTTYATGALNVSDCKNICPPGSASQTGLAPCTPCPRSTYNPYDRQIDCIPCPDGTTTQDDGTLDIQDCAAADLMFGVPGRPSKPLKIFQNPHNSTSFNDQYQGDLTVVFGIRLENTNSSCEVLTIEESRTKKHFLSLTVHGYNVSVVTPLDNLGTTDLYQASLQQGMAYVTFFSAWNSELWYQEAIEVFGFYNNGISHNRYLYGRIRRPNTIPEELDITIGNNCTNAMITQLSVSHDIQEPLSHICNTVISGNILNFTDLIRSDAATPYVRVPSLCSEADFCQEYPCQNNGTCRRKFRGFTCECMHGFTGKTCETDIDDCQKHDCENGAECIDGINSYICSCMKGFSGTLCDKQKVNGDWSDWSEWDQCSRTCGEGQRSRHKQCNAPLPQHGGDICTGPDVESSSGLVNDTGDYTEIEACNIGDCPNCTKVLPPVNGTVHCERYEDDSMACNVTCADNYISDIDSEILCNDNSSYLWPDQDPASTFYRPPACKAFELPTSVDVEIAIPYKGVNCKGGTTEATAALQQTADENAKKTNCKGNCTQEVKVRCDDLGRRKRDADRPNAFITYKIKADIYSPMLQGVETRSEQDTDSEIDLFLASYEAAFDSIAFAGETLANETMEGGFDIEVDGVTYAGNVDLIDTTGEISCPDGAVMVDGICSVCGIGTFYDDYYGCIPCPIGQYQDMERKTECKMCPDDFTSENTGSIDVAECSVMLTTPEPPTTTATPVSTDATQHVPIDVMSSTEARQDKHEDASVSAGPSTDLIIGVTIGCSVLVLCLVIAIIAVLVVRSGKRSQQYVLNQGDYK